MAFPDDTSDLPVDGTDWPGGFVSRALMSLKISQRFALLVPRVSSTGWVTNAMTAFGSNTINNQQVIRDGSWCELLINLTLASAVGDGDVPNVQLATVTDSRFVPGLVGGPLQAATNGPCIQAGVEPSTGNIVLYSTSGAIAAGATINLVGTYRV